MATGDVEFRAGANAFVRRHCLLLALGQPDVVAMTVATRDLAVPEVRFETAGSERPLLGFVRL